MSKWAEVEIGSKVAYNTGCPHCGLPEPQVGEVIDIFAGGPGGRMERSTGTWFVIRWPDGHIAEEHHLAFEDWFGLGARIKKVEEE